MSTATILFLVIGGLAGFVLILGLLGVELFDLDGFLPLEVVAAMLGAFGFAAAIASTLWSGSNLGAAAFGAAVGAIATLPTGWLTLKLVRATRQMHTDATPNREDLVGSVGMVLTAIPPRGYGEVSVSLGGQPVKLNATSSWPLPRGTEVFVITAPSDTSVVVEPMPTTPETTRQV